MRTILAILILTSFAAIARSQTVPRIEREDVEEAKAHPQCSNGNITTDNRAMPEGTSEDITVASYMREFRTYRRRGNKQQNPNMMIHINNDQIKSDARIRDVTPKYFHIETFGPKGNISYCFKYIQITQVNYDSNGNLHISVRQ